MTSPIRRIHRRFSLLVALSAVGALLFVPFLQADAPARLTAVFLVVFVCLTTAVAALASWVGLAWAERANLPMPLLRAFENRAALPRATSLVTWGLGCGVAVGGAGLAVLRLLDVPTSAASLSVRLGSAVFAAVTLESVLHLAIMSGAVRGSGRRDVGIAVATLAYMVFHLSTLGGQPASVIALASVGNGIAGLCFGWLYARQGYEALVLAHLTAHAIAVGLA